MALIPALNANEEERQNSQCTMLVNSIVFMNVLMLVFVIVLMLVMLHADELECGRDRVENRVREY